MQYELTHERHQAVDQELSRIEGYLVSLAKEIRDTTAPADRHNHTWLQADSAVSYIRSLRAALQRAGEGQR